MGIAIEDLLRLGENEFSDLFGWNSIVYTFQKRDRPDTQRCMKFHDNYINIFNVCNTFEQKVGQLFVFAGSTRTRCRLTGRHHVHASGELQRVLRRETDDRKVQKRHEEMLEAGDYSGGGHSVQ